MADATALAGPAFLVQVENHPAGRPTSGLNAADLVMEMPVEGATTRFGPVYLCGAAPEEIGPVRSARYYNPDLWQQLHAITIHFGAGGAVLNEFARKGMPYVNGITGGWSFLSRHGPRGAPHNVYLDLEAAREAAQAGALGGRVEQAGTPRPVFDFAEEAELAGGRTVAGVTIFTNNYWNFGWAYDETTDLWLRSDGGALAVDALTGEALSAKSVVVQLVTESIVAGELDAGGYPRRRQHLVGSGTGLAYVGGEAVDLRWERPAEGDVTTWTYADTGEPLILPPGRVWWEIIPVGSSVTER
jgi:hypothetical protein